jgi:hypothetical protein
VCVSICVSGVSVSMSMSVSVSSRSLAGMIKAGVPESLVDLVILVAMEITNTSCVPAAAGPAACLLLRDYCM